MTKNHFYEKKGPYPLNEIVKAIACDNKLSNKNNIEIGNYMLMNWMVQEKLLYHFSLSWLLGTHLKNMLCSDFSSS